MINEREGQAPSIRTGHAIHPTGSAPNTSLEHTLPDVPTGSVTFLFTDIEGSTSLWERDAEAMRHAFARQETILRETMAAHGGYVYKMIGDAFQVAFSKATDALTAALAAQRSLHTEPWGAIGPLRVRMALHTCVTEERGDDYVGPNLNRIARLLGAGHGGQVLLTQTTTDLLRDHLPEGVAIRDLGEHPLKDLVQPEHIYQAEIDGVPADFPPLKTVGARHRTLPTPTTPFIGRDDELTQIEELLQNPACRLISLVGLGGSGKTRLSIEAATRTQGFSHGAHFVGLAATDAVDGVISAIADAIQAPPYLKPRAGVAQETAQTQVFTYLANREALLVLDNCEHLLAQEGHRFVTLIADLLTAAPRVKLITTSRERLNLPGEWVLSVTGLPFPNGDEGKPVTTYGAVQLFVEGAQRACGFTADDADWPFIARICQLLGGMPLGIEMAAGWTKALTCQEIAADLERDLLSLIATWRTAPPRHRTLRTVFDHSWQLLSEEERDVTRKLSVFRSGFRREAATEVADASLPVLGRLIDTSFLRRTPEGRFEIHPALRRYGAEKLAADPPTHTSVRQRHAGYYCTWLSQSVEKLKGRDQITALDALRMETQDLHNAWRWLIEQRDLQNLRKFLPGVILFHEMRSRPFEAQKVSTLLLATSKMLDALADMGDPPGEAIEALRALVLAAIRHFRMAIEPPERLLSYQQESLKIAQKLPVNEEKAFALLLNCMGSSRPDILTLQQSCELCRECIAIFRQLNDPWGAALAHLILGDGAGFGLRESALARTHYQIALKEFTRLGNDWGRALCLTGLAHLDRQAGRLEDAFRMQSESLNTYLRMGDPWRVVMIRQDLGEIAEAMGAIDEARRHYEANLTHFSRLGDDRGRDYYLMRLQQLTGRAGTPQTSALLTCKQDEDAEEEPRPPIDPLSAREIEVLELLAKGLTNHEIAQHLYISPNTVRVHTYHIYDKLAVSNRTQASAKARGLGLLPS